jgi:membrane-associated phospholipid phosphatase
MLAPGPSREVLLRLPRYMLPAASLPALTYVVPSLNPFSQPHPDLTGPVAVAAYWIAESGGKQGIPWIGAAMTALVVGRSGISAKRRVIEALVIALTLLAMLGGGAFLNEHFVKPRFAVSRPNILELSQTPAEAPILGLSVHDFYALPDKAARSEHLKKVLTPAVALDDLVRGHWIAETGYSFPSGHSFSAMMFATFFLAMGLTHFNGRQRWICYALVVWAVAVCFSRPILRVHSPTDVCVGALEGVLMGTLAFVLAGRIMAVLSPQSALDASLKGSDRAIDLPGN